MKLNILLLLFFVIFIYSCNTILCGKLNDELQAIQDSANNKYSEHLLIENIPCEYYYINLTFKNNYIDTNLIHSVHEILYNKERRIGWQVIFVYNSKGEYIFSHNIWFSY